MKEENKEFIFGKDVETIILIVLSAFSLFVNLFRVGSVGAAILFFLTTALVLLAIWILFFNKNYFASYFILGLTLYFNGLIQLIRYIFSLNFGGNMVMAFNWPNIILALGAIYIGFLVVSYYLKDGFSFNKDNFKFELLILVFAGFAFLKYGVEGFIYVAFIEFLAINHRKEASLALMLSKAISPLFEVIIITAQFGFQAVTLLNILLLIVGLVIVALIVDKSIKLYKEYKEQKLVKVE